MADGLSRASLHHTGKSSTENDVQIHVDCVVSQIPGSRQKWIEFADATASDSVLQEVICEINSPGDEKLPSPHQHFRDELSVIDKVLLKGSRIVAPNTKRQQMTELVHEGHMGIEKCKRRARDVMYWPYMRYSAVRFVNTDTNSKKSHSYLILNYVNREGKLVLICSN